MRTRGTHRRRLFWWTLPVVVVLALAGVFLLALWAWNLWASSVFASGDYGEAEVAYRRQAAVSELFPEPWKGVYNEGTAQLGDLRFAEAAGTLERALAGIELTPVTPGSGLDQGSPECLIRTNLSLSYEGLGDEARDSGDSAGAIGRYRDALDMIGPCTSDGRSAADQTERPLPVEGVRPDVDEQRQWDKLNEARQRQEEEEQQSIEEGQEREGEGDDDVDDSEGGEGQQPRPEELDPRLQELIERNNEAGAEMGPSGGGFGGGQNW
ncbi:MAG TPA: hypothetical protein VFC82_09075 [Actinomycetaceae bacterium]|nr:hypothetical protein [Actinomycetaceae bacterium]